MGRHATPTTTTRRGWPPPPLVLIAALAVVVLVAGGLVWWLAGSDDGDTAACGADGAVQVAVTPELVPVVQELLSAESLPGNCVTADVSAQDSLQTAAALTAGVDTGVPDVWVPDSSIWPAQVEGATVEQVGSMATSPLVLATSRASAEDLELLEDTPGWLDVVIAALTAGRSMPLVDLTGSARQIGITLAVEQTGGGEEVTDEELEASLGLARSGATVGAVRTASIAGDADAGLWAATEQDVLASHLAGDSEMVAVYPEGGSTFLDYPVLRTGDPDGDRRAAVDTVVSALTSDDAAAAVRAAGFRDADGNAPGGAGPDTGTREEAPERLPMDADEAIEAIEQANRVLAPSRLLTVIDTSTSMEASAAGGTRISLAVDAAETALAGLPDEYSVGLWTFAYQVDGAADHVERVPLRALDAAVDGATQREALESELESLAGSLTPGGTGLYDTALAAVRAARAEYQEGAVSSVVLLTDGTNDDDSAGISLQGLIDTLRSEADPDRPVLLIGVALGPEADLAALQQMSAATGGQAYSAEDPGDLQAVLFDAIRSR